MKILRTICIAIISFSILFTVFYGNKRINENKTYTSAQNYKGIITVWHVDSFEGGVGSRKQFLLKVAREFEKQNPGVLVMVIDKTPQSVEESLKDKQFPDMISFGAGVKVSGFVELNNISSFKGGKVGDKTFAVPWCRGGYVLIANPKLVNEIPNELESVLVSQGQLNSTLTALAMENIQVKNVKVLSPMDAYVEFVLGKTPYFLGTQRDINRLFRRDFSVLTKAIENYNDLYQYICITTNNSLKKSYSEKYIDLLLSRGVQKSLKDIGMLGVNSSVDYENEHLQKMQKVKPTLTVSAFILKEQLQELSDNSLSFLKGNKEYKIKIKNMLI